MNIVNAKNTLLSEEYKVQQEIQRHNRKQDKEYENFHKQIEVLHNDTYTANTRLLQMQRRILEVESIVGIPPTKLPWITLNCIIILQLANSNTIAHLFWHLTALYFM